jgi:hypothetical protein
VESRRQGLEIFAVSSLLSKISREGTCESRVVKRVQYRVIKDLARVDMVGRRWHSLTMADGGQARRFILFTEAALSCSRSWRYVI